MNKHTAGPWYITTEQFGDMRRIVGDCNVVRMAGPCDAVIVSLGADNEEQSANAKMIAAAPDMLDALRGYISAIDDGGISMADLFTHAEQLARAAIAKATA